MADFISVTWQRADGQDVPGLVTGPKGAPGVVAIQEWWGVDGEIKAHAQHIAAQGYRVVIPDLYRGKLGVEAEEAHHLMTGLDFPGATKDIAGAAAWLKAEGSAKVGVTGFCMGGALTLLTAILEPANFSAAAPFYGIPPADCANVNVPVQGHYGRTDAMKGFSAPEDVAKLREALAKSPVAGASEVFEYEGSGHAFMNATPEGIARRSKLGQGEHRQDNVDLAWSRLFAFFDRHLKH